MSDSETSVLDGLWTLEYEGQTYLSGGGVVVVRGNKLCGGDSWYFYEGTIKVQGKQVSADVKAKAFIRGASSVFGPAIPEFSVKLLGELGQDTVRGRLIPAFAQQTNIGVLLIKRVQTV